MAAASDEQADAGASSPPRRHLWAPQGWRAI
jgi:hypothetical protein